MGPTRRTFTIALGLTPALVLASCSSGSGSGTGTTTTTEPGATSVADSGLPDEIKSIMSKSRYADATWSLLVTDIDTGKSFYDAQPGSDVADRIDWQVVLGRYGTQRPGRRPPEITPVYRTAGVDAQGTLAGDLVLVGQGDLTFGGRRIDDNTIQVTDLDHGDANHLGVAQLTPQDPLYGLDRLAAQVSAAGITKVDGEVAIDDRFFKPYRVPNGKLLITPVLVNENMVDVTITPTQPGQPAAVDYRPKTGAFSVTSTVVTGPPGSDASVELSDDGLITCLGQPGCSGTISGSIPADFKAPLTGDGSMVQTFRIEDPNAFARTAFIEALGRQGVTVTAAAVNRTPRVPCPSAPPTPTTPRSPRSPRSPTRRTPS